MKLYCLNLKIENLEVVLWSMFEVKMSDSTPCTIGRVMQSGVNTHKANRIVGCKIVYVIFLSITNQTKKKVKMSCTLFKK